MRYEKQVRQVLSDSNNHHRQEGTNMSTFTLNPADERAIAIAIDTARSILRNHDLTPQQIIGLGNALYALERMPEATNGVFSSFGYVFRAGDREVSEM